MKLDRVTITGADESVRPLDLSALSERFPFVEWGILVSKNHATQGSPRFPGELWHNALIQHSEARPALDMKLSLHVCGHWVRQLLLGIDEVPFWMLRATQRVQLNFHAEKTECRPTLFAAALLGAMGEKQIIFQIDGANGNKHLEALFDKMADVRSGPTVDAVALFDISGGAGVLPKEWPKPFYMVDDQTAAYCGYAGGLGPDNLKDQLHLIASAADDARIWIDMETRVRSDGDLQFDLSKVERCLEIAAEFVER